jgi:hypothetical protein
MKKVKQTIFLVCGLLLTLAAVPVFAQENDRIQLNKRPLQDLADLVSEKIAQGKFDLTKPFSIQLEGVLNKDGKLDPKKSKFNKGEGDAAMIEIGKSFIQSINDSGFFYYLKQLGIEKVNLTLSQDETTVKGIIKSELPTQEKAKTIASGLNGLFVMAKTLNKGDDVKILLENWHTEADAKNLSISFAAPRGEIHEFVVRELRKIKEKKQANR